MNYVAWFVLDGSKCTIVHEIRPKQARQRISPRSEAKTVLAQEAEWITRKSLIFRSDAY